jgi:Ni,Fe-hydrogenase maturation factor
VPKLGTFYIQNHDLLKLWFEDQLETHQDRMFFPLRILRFLTQTCILFIFVYVIIGPQDTYFQEECKKR